MKPYNPLETQEIYRCSMFDGDGDEVLHRAVKRDGMTPEIERIIEIWDEDNGPGWSFWATHEMTIHPDGPDWVLTIHYVGYCK